VNQTELAMTCPGYCSKHGVCLDTTCECFSGYTGPDCATKLCINNCSGNGVCVEGDCKCRPGYFGQACDVRHCMYNCHGNGFCHNGQTCSCHPGYGGVYCEDVLGCPRNCSGRGECAQLVNPVSKEVEFHCLCGSGYGGKACQDRLCLNNCNGRGQCDSKSGKCVCEPRRYHGEDCSKVLCPNNCSANGRCNDTDGTCKCFPGYFGVDCSPLNCYLDCSGRGHCVPGMRNVSRTNAAGRPPTITTVPVAKCRCKKGYAGDGCERDLCPNQCGEKDGHGNCTAKGCNCSAYWTGPGCTQQRCPFDCTSGRHGLCDPKTFLCSCMHGWAGEACNERTCPTLCNYRGVCSNGTCECDDWWAGKECEIPVCKANCSHHGTCLKPNMKLLSALSAKGDALSENIQSIPVKQQVDVARCRCDPGYGGPDCSERLCPNDCRGRGVCNNGVCFCNTAWYGDDCGLSEALAAVDRNLTPEIAALKLCTAICVHGKCITVPPSSNSAIFRLNPPSNLTALARNSSTLYECFCESQWAGPHCNRSLVHCPLACLDRLGVCRKDCKYGNKNPCPIEPQSRRMCGGSKRGRCEFETGECVCKKPYLGIDCGTASCPDDCSGHGMCNYRSMKCLCFGGWTGPNCSIRLNS